MMNKILIIGGGRLGSALKKILIKSNPIIWDIDPKISESKIPLEQEVKTSNLILICTPAIALEKILTQIKKYLKEKSLIISCSKGLSEKGKFTFEVLQSALNDTLDAKQNYGILAGPLMAEELEKNLETVGTLALKNQSQFLEIKKLFTNSPIHLTNSNDIKGLSVVGTLKNVYALFLGIVDELKLGDNLKAVLLTKSFREIKIINKIFGGKLTTLNSSAGLADLITTVYSPYSRNATNGRTIIQGKNCNSEGCRTLPLLAQRLKDKNKLPILNSLSQIIIEPKNAKTIIADILPH